MEQNICAKKVLYRNGIVPDLDGPIRTAGYEDVGMVRVPTDSVDTQVVCLVRVDERHRVISGADVNPTLFRSDDVDVFSDFMEIQCCSTSWCL